MPRCPDRVTPPPAGAVARLVGRFAAATGGNTVITFALALPMLIGVVGVGLDYSMASAARTKMQGIADAAAIAAAQELQIARSDPTKIAAAAITYVNAVMQGVTITTNVDVNASTVQVILNRTYVSMMGTLIQRNGIALSVSSTARMNGSLPLCLLGLDPSADATVYLEKAALLTATGCLVQSNSTSKKGMESKNSATLTAGLICSSGGKVKTSNANFSPDATTDCPVIPDPLSARVAPGIGACNYTNKVSDATTETLQPGVYCGGLLVTNTANVTLAPGIFIIKDGPLMVTNGATLSGTEVAIYLTGATANLTFDFNTTISLAAPSTGALAGILVYDDPSGAPAPATVYKYGTGDAPREHLILSDNARMLLGTIYMPQGRLIVDANQPIADQSAYTVLVVRQINLYSGPNLVLNSNYTATQVPVPMGLGPYGAKVSLTQ